jgi:uncharacterized membrane protein YdbT with pleckstrin-like domain
MAFPQKLLIEGEEIVLDLRPHWWFLAPRLLATAAAIILGIIVWVQVEGTLGDVLGAITGILILAALVWFLLQLAKWATTEFVLTTERVIYRYGVIGKKGKEIPLDKINTVFFDQTVFERMIGCGTVAMESAGESGKDSFTHIRKPSVVQSEIYRQMEANQERGHARMGQAVKQGSGLSVAEQLEKLNSLRQSGALTDAEYEAQKARLLAD